MRQSAVDPRPALVAIGDALVESTKHRFETASGPDGTPWDANSEVTILRYLGRAPSNFKKDGSLSKKGETAKGSKKPLAGKTGALKQQIRAEVDASELRVGATMKYAAMQQFGGAKDKFPWLWGDIPARPFLPIRSDGTLYESARVTILEILAEHIASD